MELAKGCRKLKTLILSFCHEVMDGDIGELFTYCTQLTCLDIRDWRQGARPLSDDSTAITSLGSEIGLL